MDHLSARLLACAVIWLLGAGVALADDDGLPAVIYPDIARQADVPEDFVPPGWRIEHRIDGRLDDDALADLVLLLRMDDPANRIEHDGLGMSPFDTNPRMLVAAFADASGRWQRAMVDYALIPRTESATMDDYLQDDPAATITLDDERRLRIRLHSFASAGSWYTSSTGFTFRHQDGCFRLIGYDTMELHRASLAMKDISVNYLTGQASVSEGSAEDDGLQTRWAQVRQREPICIESVGNGFGFSPEIVDE